MAKTTKTTMKTTKILFLGLALGGALAGSGCATQQLELTTPRYSVTYEDYWQKVAESKEDGKPSVFKIGTYGGANAFDETSSGGAVSEDRLAPTEVRIYGWAADPNVKDATAEVFTRLLADPDLELRAHGRMNEDLKPDCGILRKTFNVIGTDTLSINLVYRPKWKTLIVGGQGQHSLIGVVARVPFENDPGRYCQNYSKMLVQLREALAVIRENAAPPAAPAAPAAAAPAAPAGAGGAPPASGPPAAGDAPAPAAGAPTPPPAPQP